MSTYCARYQHVFAYVIPAARDTALIYHLLRVEGRGLCTTASFWNALLMVILEANAACSGRVLLHNPRTSPLLSLAYQDKLCSLYYPATLQLKTLMQSIEETEDSNNRLNPQTHSGTFEKNHVANWKLNSVNCYFQSLLADWPKYSALQFPTPKFS